MVSHFVWQRAIPSRGDLSVKRRAFMSNASSIFPLATNAGQESQGANLVETMKHREAGDKALAHRCAELASPVHVVTLSDGPV